MTSAEASFFVGIPLLCMALYFIGKSLLRKFNIYLENKIEYAINNSPLIQNHTVAINSLGQTEERIVRETNASFENLNHALENTPSLGKEFNELRDIHTVNITRLGEENALLKMEIDSLKTKISMLLKV